MSKILTFLVTDTLISRALSHESDTVGFTQTMKTLSLGGRSNYHFATYMRSISEISLSD